MADQRSFAERITARHKAIELERDELRSMLATVLAGIDSGNLDAKTLKKARSMVEGKGK